MIAIDCGCGLLQQCKCDLRLFRRALNELGYNGYKEKDMFDRIDFAVLDRTPAKFNYKQFKRNFGI